MHKLLKKGGFTIVEIAAVLIIGGLLIGALSSGFLIYIKQAQVDTTKERILGIEQAIYDYLSNNQKLPCPAPTNAGVDTVGFGREADVVVGGIDCNSAAGVAGLTPATAWGNANNVAIGSVPVRTLNLPDSFVADAWGGRFTYAVTANLAIAGGYTTNGGQITVNDGGGNPVVPFGAIPPAQFVLLSHGPDNIGAFSLGSAAAAPAPLGNCATAGLDQDNCDNDATFIRTILTSTNQAGGNRFDDLVLYNQLEQVGEIPRGAIVAFDTAGDGTSPFNCPPGWTQYAQADGRVLVGKATTATLDGIFGPGNYPVEVDTTTPGAPSAADFTNGAFTETIDIGELPSHTHNVNLADPDAVPTPAAGGDLAAAGTNIDSGVDIISNGTGGAAPMPIFQPFLALTYCRKD